MVSKNAEENLLYLFLCFLWEGVNKKLEGATPAFSYLFCWMRPRKVWRDNSFLNCVVDFFRGATYICKDYIV